MSGARMAGSTFIHGAHVRANGIRQHYLRFGGEACGGVPLVIVPGITSPAATWAFVGERLGQRYDTYVLDVRGRGLSSTGCDLDYSLQTCADDITAFARALGLTRFHMLGHSMGARFATRAAHGAAGAVQRLVLADPPLSGPGRRPYVKTLAFYLDAIRQAQAGEMDIVSVRAAYPAWSDAQVQARAEWLHTCDITAITAAHQGFQEDDVHADLSALAMPVLLMVAGRGDVIRPEELADVQALVPALEVSHFPQASHMIPFDDLEGFAQSVEDFLA